MHKAQNIGVECCFGVSVTAPDQRLRGKMKNNFRLKLIYRLANSGSIAKIDA